MKLQIALVVACVTAIGCGPDNNSNAEPNNTDPNSSANANPNNTSNSSANNTANSSANNTANANPNNSSANSGSATCNPAFAEADACGGMVDGTWNVTDVCSDYDYQAAFEDVCADATVNSVEYDLSGQLSVASPIWTYTIEGTISAAATIPESCASQVGGCAGVQGALGLLASEAACSDNGGDCDCTATFDGNDVSSGNFTADGGVATVDNGDEWLFCVEGDSLTLRERNGAEDRPVFVLDKT